MITTQQLKNLFYPIYLPPIFIPSLGILTGIIIAAMQSHIVFLFSIVLLLGVSYYSRNNYIFKKSIIFTLLSLLAYFSYLKQTKPSPLKNWENQSISLFGTVNNIEMIGGRPYPYRLTLNVSNIFNNQSIWVNEHIWVYMNKKPQCVIDDRILINNIVLRSIQNESFKQYLFKEGIAQTIFLHRQVNLLYRPSFSLRRSLMSWRQELLNRLSNKMDTQTNILFNSIFFGKKIKTTENESHKELFKKWGLSHYLARSGLHLIIFIMFWNAILSLIPLSFHIKQLISLFLILLYGLLSWPSTSFMRAIGTFIIYKAFILTNKQTHSLHTILLVGSLLLLYNPYLLFFVDFQLSFIFAAALALILQSYNDCMTAP
jgi:Competence protein